MGNTKNYPKIQTRFFTLQVKLIYNTSWEQEACHHCGYVSFPRALLPYLKIDEINCHGGVTFDEAGKENPPLHTIGFDCAHSQDSRTPGDLSWKDYFYAEAECRSIAQQLWEQIDNYGAENA
jgi:hypothetical protein